MAEKTEKEKPTSSPENLTCPLCLDIFNEATILTSCGHTFCRKCLKNYDLSHQDLDHMICPLCREVTKLSANRVDDFLTNVAVNGLVDDYHVKCGGMNAVLEMRPKCTACISQGEAVSFCKTCNSYLCEQCLICHQSLSLMFKAHEIVSMQDIINGKVSIGHLSEKCYIHKQENKDMFCEDCKVHGCLKCVIVGHQNHKIKNQADFEQELRLKVKNLVQRCATKNQNWRRTFRMWKYNAMSIHCSAESSGRSRCHAEGWVTDHTSAAAITKKAQEKRFKPADDSRLDLGSISESDPKVQVFQCVDLRGKMFGMTQYSDDSVAIGYGDALGIDIIDSAGKQEQYANIPTIVTCFDLVFQQDRSLCISSGGTEAHIYSPNGSGKSTIHHVKINYYYPRLNKSPSDEILITTGEKQVYIYNSTGSTLKHTVPTKHNETRQVSATRSGLIVTSSCDIKSYVVTVYDRDGNAGRSLQAPDDVYLYAAMDEQDRVFVASVDRKNGNVVIRLYDLDGLNLKERVKFNVLNLALGSSWCYLISLSPDMLAFACHNKLYFIKVSL
eukprot:XP_011669473.1 PREDICTED: uncharacterized protein LOC593824 [Strongylocentrotus purpuratus]